MNTGEYGPVKRILPSALLIALSAGGLFAAVKPREVADEDIDRVIEETVRYLYAQQNARTGLWSDVSHHAGVNCHTGASALALFALLETGQHPEDPRMKRALDALVKKRVNTLYVVAVRTMALSMAVTRVKGSPYLKALKADVAWLTRHAQRHGAWGYGGPEREGDNSCSQFALLALWEADRAGVAVKPSLIRRIEGVWAKRQQADGGWKYTGQDDIKGRSTTPMTAAALASMYICRDISSTASGPYRFQKNLDSAWRLLISGLNKGYIGNGYLAFCVQRVGMATGRKFLGEMDWFQVGASVLCKPRPLGKSYGGRWGSIVRASFELIFLARGRIPLTYNKLQYGAEENWNHHNRDVPRFTEYMRRNFEQRMRWQVVKLTEDVTQMLDAPILLISGARALKFTGADWAKLREYTLRGGTLLFVPSRKSEEFLKSVTSALRNLYKDQRRLVGDYYTVEKLPADHPVYSVNQTIENGDEEAPLWGLSDGTRLLAIVSARDVAASWQRYARVGGRIDYKLGANFFFYATGGNPMRRRMRPVFAGSAREVRHHVKVAWLKHDGNWHTQPHALKYVSQKLTAENRVGIKLDVGVPIEAGRLRRYHLLWLTASREFDLTDAQIDALRGCVNRGGMLFVNVIGGSKKVRRRVRRMFDRLFSDTAVAQGFAGPDCPLVTGVCGDFRGPNLTKLRIRRSVAWRKAAPKMPGLRLRLYEKDNRVVAIFAPYGIHDTLDGHAGYGAMSYLPAPARAIAANIVLYALVNSKR